MKRAISLGAEPMLLRPRAAPRRRVCELSFLRGEAFQRVLADCAEAILAHIAQKPNLPDPDSPRLPA